MRLIDADKLPYVGDETYLHEFDYCYRYAIDAEPTVDAIPVEWIKRWSKEPMTEKDMKLAEQCEWNILEWLIADWQRKKE